MPSIPNNPIALAPLRPAATALNAVADTRDRIDAVQANDSPNTATAAAQVTNAVAPTAESSDVGDSQTSERPAEETRTQADADPSSDAAEEAVRREIDALQARDREVRAHEQAHLAAAGQYASGGIQYTFERGPDGRMYAVGGQVSVDTSEIPGDPQATLLKAQTLRRAALAPAEPSGQDRAVAAQRA